MRKRFEKLREFRDDADVPRTLALSECVLVATFRRAGTQEFSWYYPGKTSIQPYVHPMQPGDSVCSSAREPPLIHTLFRPYRYNKVKQREICSGPQNVYPVMTNTNPRILHQILYDIGNFLLTLSLIFCSFVESGALCSSGFKLF